MEEFADGSMEACMWDLVKIKQVDSCSASSSEQKEAMSLLHNSPAQAKRCENYLNCYYHLNVHKKLAFIWKPNLLGSHIRSFLPFLCGVGDSSNIFRQKEIKNGKSQAK